MTGWFKTGTINVTNGSAAVVGIGTGWSTAVYQGDFFTTDWTTFYEVLSVADDIHLTLAKNYTGSTASSISYAIVPTSPSRSEVTTLVAQFGQMLSEYQEVISAAGNDKLALFNKSSVAAKNGMILRTADQYRFRVGTFGADTFEIGYSPTGGDVWETALNVEPTTGEIFGSIQNANVQNVINMTTATPPVSPSNGDTYLIAASPTGAWAGKVGKIARWNSARSIWLFYTPQNAQIMYNLADSNYYSYQAGVFTAFSFMTANSVATLTNKTIVNNANGNLISGMILANFAANIIDTDVALTANSDLRLATQKAAKAYIDGKFDNDATMAANSSTKAATQAATKTYVDTKVASLIASAPGALDTLDELAAALGDDPNFATTVNTALSNRLRIDVSTQGLTGTQKTNAQTNMGVVIGTDVQAFNATLTTLSGKSVTGSGNIVLATSPTITTPVISGHATIEGVTPTGATGTNLLVFGTSPALTTPAITGGTVAALTSFGVRSTGTGAFDLKIANTENLTVSDKTLTITLGNANRTFTLGGNLTTVGNFTLTLTATNTTNATIPAGTVTLVDLASTQTLTNKTINAANNTISNITTAMLVATTTFDTDTTLSANSDTRIPSQKAIKAYIDAAAQGNFWKPPVVIVFTTAVSGGLTGEKTYDGVTTSASRVLVTADGVNNGIWVTAAGAWTRATDADTGAELQGASVLVEQGTVNANTTWNCNNTTAITIGVTTPNWVKTNQGNNTTIYNEQVFTATAGQTTFSIAYTVGYVDVWKQGLKLVPGTDYTASNGTTVVLASGATVGDKIQIIAWYTLVPTAPVYPVTVTLADSGTWGSAGISNLTKLGIGMVATNIVDITQNQNAASRVSLLNNNTSTAATSEFRLNNATHSAQLILLGTGYTTSGIVRQDGLLLSSGACAGGLTLNTGAAQPIYFAINNGQVAQFDGSGRFLTPGQPRFRAERSTLASWTSSSYTVAVFDSEVYDIGGNYNNSTGVFTAPVSGYYHFDCSVGSDNTTTGQELDVYFTINGNNIFVFWTFSNESTHWYRGGSIDVFLAAGQTAYVTTWYGGTGSYRTGSFFSGHLIG